MAVTKSLDFARARIVSRWIFISKDGGAAHELGTGAVVLLARVAGTVVSWSLVVADGGARFFGRTKSGDHFHFYLDGDFRRRNVYGDRLASNFFDLGGHRMDRIPKSA